MTILERIFDFAKCLVTHSDGKLEIVKNEENASKDEQKEAATFIKLDGKRLGRDLELYNLMVEVCGVQEVLCYLLSEILIPIKKDLIASYIEGSTYLQSWGDEVFEGDRATEWKGLF